jgi:hypothetical protein
VTQQVLGFATALISAAAFAIPSWANDEASPMAALPTVVHQRFDSGTLAGWNTRRLVHADSAVCKTTSKVAAP